MIYNLTLNDRTQKKVLRELETTEKLISKVATKLSATKKTCDIYAMFDLGLAHNVTRMRGGFFTGAAYKWEETDIPFIPVDATVNVCGIALYKINFDISITEFKERCEKALADTSKYNWNFMNGNHFISLCHAEKNEIFSGLEEGYYMLVHASACEYKEELYPVVGNWYYRDIKTEMDDKNDDRYLRYIEGKKAERFYRIAKMLDSFNAERNYNFCQKVLGSQMGEEILNVAHYGMPSISEIQIGVQKTNGLAMILTSPGKSVYVVRKKEYCHYDYIIHGFGLQLPKKSGFVYHKDCIEIGGKRFRSGGIKIGEDAIYRRFPLDDETMTLIKTYSSENLEEVGLAHSIRELAMMYELRIESRLKQICSFSSDGFKIWR